MPDVRQTKWHAWLWISAVVIVLDQFTKQLIVQAFAFGESLTITSFFNLVLAYNKGAAFSMFADAGGWQKWFFMVIAATASVVIIYLLRKHANEKWFCLALALILGGALGNLIDRVLLGHVIDFIQVHGWGYYFPAFNVADSAITVGAALLIFESFKKPA
jgi:signal peptidase II